MRRKLSHELAYLPCLGEILDVVGESIDLSAKRRSCAPALTGLAQGDPDGFGIGQPAGAQDREGCVGGGVKADVNRPRHAGDSSTLRATASPSGGAGLHAICSIAPPARVNVSLRAG